MFITYRGYLFSWQFEQGQRWDRYAPGLQPGAVFGRRVVSDGPKRIYLSARSLKLQFCSHFTSTACRAMLALPSRTQIELVRPCLPCCPRTCLTSSGANSVLACPH